LNGLPSLRQSVQLLVVHLFFFHKPILDEEAEPLVDRHAIHVARKSQTVNTQVPVD
jgi:hypothetical protein